jgi:hypothetical protein
VSTINGILWPLARRRWIKSTFGGQAGVLVLWKSSP